MTDKETIVNTIRLAQHHCKPSLIAGLFDALETIIPRALEGETLVSIIDEMLNEDIQESGET